jgi:integrase
LLRARRKAPDDKDLPATAHVFGNEVGEPIDSIKTSWRATCRRAKIEDLHFHDLRREAASRMDRDKVSRTAISAQLGHARVTTTDIYLGSQDDDRKDELRDYWQGRNRRKGFAKLLQPARPKPSGSTKAPTAVH